MDNILCRIYILLLLSYYNVFESKQPILIIRM
uniref:Smp_200090 n=1 Tax=Schistosoma mansoni TaxID=6183 RepID=G4VAG4_SCHMA